MKSPEKSLDILKNHRKTIQPLWKTPISSKETLNKIIVFPKVATVFPYLNNFLRKSSHFLEEFSNFPTNPSNPHPKNSLNPLSNFPTSNSISTTETAAILPSFLFHFSRKSSGWKILPHLKLLPPEKRARKTLSRRAAFQRLFSSIVEDILIKYQFFDSRKNSV
jgi:hypothetical protein